MIFLKTVTAMAKRFAEDYNVTKTIRHKGEKGRQREDGLSMLLKDNLPTAYAVGTGEIIAYKGNDPSPQCDIIIYDHLYYPILNRFKPVQQIPLEAVYAVIEVKSKLTSAELKDADKKFTKILQLPRAESIPVKKSGEVREPTFAVFAYESALSKKSITKFQDDIVKRDKWYDHIIASLDTGVACLTGEINNPYPDYNIPVWLAEANGEDNVTLAYFYWVLFESISRITLGKPDYARIIGGIEY